MSKTMSAGSHTIGFYSLISKSSTPYFGDFEVIGLFFFSFLFIEYNQNLNRQVKISRTAEN